MSIYLVVYSQRQRLLDHCFRELRVSKHCWEHIGQCRKRLSYSQGLKACFCFVGAARGAFWRVAPAEQDELITAVGTFLLSPRCGNVEAEGAVHDRSAAFRRQGYGHNRGHPGRPQAVRDDVSRLSREVTNLLSVTGSKALREVKAQMSPLEDAVRERPFATLAIALGVGFLFGAIWRLR